MDVANSVYFPSWHLAANIEILNFIVACSTIHKVLWVFVIVLLV